MCGRQPECGRPTRKINAQVLPRGKPNVEGRSSHVRSDGGVRFQIPPQDGGPGVRHVRALGHGLAVGAAEDVSAAWAQYGVSAREEEAQQEGKLWRELHVDEGILPPAEMDMNLSARCDMLRTKHPSRRQVTAAQATKHSFTAEVFHSQLAVAPQVSHTPMHALNECHT